MDVVPVGISSIFTQLYNFSLLVVCIQLIEIRKITIMPNENQQSRRSDFLKNYTYSDEKH
jgi:hypothetical protein